MARNTILKEIKTLNPQKDHERIVFLSTCYEFSFDTTRALEIALFRTFCVPSISGLLDRTGELRQRTQKRYDETDILVSELLEWGYSSERGRRAILRINQLHGRFSITNENFLYVLSTFLFEPIRWNQRYGWRTMCEQERLGLFHFWRIVGQEMHIKDIPEDYQTFERFNIEFERQHIRYAPSNHRTGTATVNLFVGWFPRLLAPLVRSAIYALLEPSLLKAFGFPEPSRFMQWAVPSLLKLRAGVLRWLPPRRHPRLRTEMVHPSHPHGYVIEQLGPPEERKEK
ncbi:oxygenase MpaB family protein [uncultured Nitrospira sp.]|uniref:oxygenase MpaB family protein n=1 Tax=uncultured Nitrospira sp. TaxID=157176 RepID=UPI003140AAD5